MKKPVIKSGLGALRKTAASAKKEDSLMKDIHRVVDECLKDPANALQNFTKFMDERRKANNMGPSEGFVRVDVDGEVVLLSGEEAQQFIEEAEEGPEEEQRIAAKMKRVLTCVPEELLAEAFFVRMLVEATLEAYVVGLGDDDSPEAKELRSLVTSVQIRLQRRMTVLEQDGENLKTTEKKISQHRKASAMEEFERTIQQLQQARAEGDVATLRKLTGEIQANRAAYERATHAIDPSIYMCKIARRDTQVHISVFLRYLEALVHKKKEALVSSVGGLRDSVDSGDDTPSLELQQKEKELESIEQQKNFVSAQARESEAVAAAVTKSQGLTPTKPQADVQEIMDKAGVKPKKPSSTAPIPEPETKGKSSGMHGRR